MLKSLSKLILCLTLSVSLAQTHAQTDQLLKELRANAYNLSLSSLVDPAKGQKYEITSSGNVIYFRKGGKLLASLNLAQMDFSNMWIVKRSDRTMLQFVCLREGAFKYFHSPTNSMKGDVKGAILHLRYYSRGERLLEMAQAAVLEALPKGNITLKCRGNAKNLKRVGITIRAITHDGRYIYLTGGRFGVVGSTGTYVIKGAPIGAKIGVWIEYPSEFSSENSDGRLSKPNKEFIMPTALGRAKQPISMSLR